MLSFLRRAFRKPLEVHRRPKIEFLGEQDGPPERLLKDALREAFTNDAGVERAYLVRVNYGDASRHNVALFVRCPEDARVVRVVGEHFAKLFGREQHLDIGFLDDAQEAEIRRVAVPFFVRA